MKERTKKDNKEKARIKRKVRTENAIYEAQKR